MSAQNKNILMVIAPVDFQDQEYGDTREEIEKAGFGVKVASLEKGIAQGKYGAEAEVDLLVSEVNVDEFDAVVFVGGHGMAEQVDNARFQKLAKDFYEAGKLTTAICIAPVVLAKAGLLKGKDATAHESGKEQLILEGANYTGDDVLVNGRIITANGPMASSGFGQAIVQELEK